MCHEEDSIFWICPNCGGLTAVPKGSYVYIEHESCGCRFHVIEVEQDD
jgi:hypothetical protein